MPSLARSCIVVGLSGGVDSTMAAALLRAEGHKVIGVTLQVTPAGEGSGLEPAARARRVAEQLGIDHHVWDCSAEFEREVIGYFTREYQAGRTPNPCVRCNRRVKFEVLRRVATRLGAHAVATGHYARVEPRGTRVALRRGAWRPKDQSYVLAGLSQDQLRATRFPLGTLSKDEVRDRARALGLEVADAAESQELCFVPGDDYGAFLATRVGAPAPGPILTPDGTVLGRHRGLIYFTVGQRRGLGIAGPRPYYVLRLDVERNALVVGHEEDAYCPALVTGPVNWCGAAPQAAPFRCHAQIRYLHRAAPAIARPADAGLRIEFEEPQKAVTPGQWAALYDEDGYVLAGAVIEAQG